MKRQLWTLLAIVWIAGQLAAQTPTLTPSLGWRTFVQGISPVNNEFTVQNPANGTDSVAFEWFTADAPNVITSRPGTFGAGGWSIVLDMGAQVPGTTIRAICFKKRVEVGRTADVQLGITAKPAWLQHVTMRNLTVNPTGFIASFDLPLGLDINMPIDDEKLELVRGYPFQIHGSRAHFVAAYYFATRASVVSTAGIQPNPDPIINFGNEVDIPYAPSGISLDADFNLAFNTNGSPSPEHAMRLDRRLLLQPYGPSGPTVLAMCSMHLIRTARASLVAENTAGGWEFLRKGADVTGMWYDFRGSGWMRDEFLVQGEPLGFVRGCLATSAAIGGGITRVSRPVPDTGRYRGGAVRLYGQFASPNLTFSPAHSAPGMLYEARFYRESGSPPAGSDTIARISSISVDTNLRLPAYSPQPVLAGRDGTVAAAWIDNTTGTTSLFFSHIRRTDAAFSCPIAVTENLDGPGSPALAMCADGSAVIAWTQNRYSARTLPSGASLHNILRAQDVHVALIGSVRSDSEPAVIATAQIPDDMTGPETGRAESTPKLAVLSDGRLMLTWLAQEADGRSSIWYSVLNRAGNSLIVGIPTRLTDMGGMNRSLRITPIDSGRAMVAWISYPEGYIDIAPWESKSRICYTIWNGSFWSEPHTVAQSIGTKTFEGLALAIRGTHGMILWTGRNDFGSASGGLVDCRYWDGRGMQWLPPTNNVPQLNDDGHRYANPEVAIKDDTTAVYSYRVITLGYSGFRGGPIASDGEGERHARTYRLSDPNKPGSGLDQFISDRSAFAWTSSSAFGADSMYYQLSEEQYREDSEQTPVAGVRFGDRRLGLVLRRVAVHPDLTVDNTDEPHTPGIGTCTPKDNMVYFLESNIRLFSHRESADSAFIGLRHDHDTAVQGVEFVLRDMPSTFHVADISLGESVTRPSDWLLEWDPVQRRAIVLATGIGASLPKGQYDHLLRIRFEASDTTLCGDSITAAVSIDSVRSVLATYTGKSAGIIADPARRTLSCVLHDGSMRGDVNGDGHVNILDVLLMIDARLGRVKLRQWQRNRADVAPVDTTDPRPFCDDMTSGDGMLDVGDVVAVVNAIAQGKWPGNKPLGAPHRRENDPSSNEAGRREPDQAASMPKSMSGSSAYDVRLCPMVSNDGIKVRMENHVPVQGVQLALCTGDVSARPRVKLGEAVGNLGFTFDSASIGDTMRVLMYSLCGDSIDIGDHELFSVTFDVRNPAGVHLIGLPIAGGADRTKPLLVGSCSTVVSAVDSKDDPTLLAASLTAVPNPFGDRAAIAFTLGSAANVTLTISDVTGREVARVIDGAHMNPGVQTAELDARGLPCGLYVIRLKAGAAEAVRTAILVR